MGQARTSRQAIHRSAVIDIGSNSVRIVVYEGPARAPAVIFNEKVAAGLGRGLSTDGRIAAEDAERGLVALRADGRGPVRRCGRVDACEGGPARARGRRPGTIG